MRKYSIEVQALNKINRCFIRADADLTPCLERESIFNAYEVLMATGFIHDTIDPEVEFTIKVWTPERIKS